MSDAARRIASVIEWLKRPDWGQWKYMEGSEIYTHKENALVDLNAAVVALEDAEAAAFRRGVEAMRRKAKEACRKVVVKGDSLDWRVAAKECRLAIAALPPPEDKG